VALIWSHYLALRQVGSLGVLGLGTTAWFLAASILLIVVHAPSRAVAPVPLLESRADPGHAPVVAVRRRSRLIPSRRDRGR
jgi:hypothetical protein